LISVFVFDVITFELNKLLHNCVIFDITFLGTRGRVRPYISHHAFMVSINIGRSDRKRDWNVQTTFSGHSLRCF